MKFVLTNPGLLCPFVMSFSVPSPSPYPTFRLPRLFQFCLHVASFTGVWSNKFNNNYCRRTAERYSSKKRPTQTGTRILNLVYLALTFSVHIHTRHTQAGRHHQVSSSCPELGNIREMHQVPRTSRLQGPHSRRRCHLPASTSCSGRRACHKHIPVHLQSLLLPLLVQPLRLAHHVSMC
jgi:hypothetical protein